MEIKVKHLDLSVTAEQLVGGLLAYSRSENICLLDSCAVGYLESRYLIAGIKLVEMLEISNREAHITLASSDEIFDRRNLFKFLTISYDFGRKIQGLYEPEKPDPKLSEPDIFICLFDTLIVYDYQTHQTVLIGNEQNFPEFQYQIESWMKASAAFDKPRIFPESAVKVGFTKSQYLSKISQIKQEIRRGNTYQTNLTQHFQARLCQPLDAQNIFLRLRTTNPAPFSAFIQRKNSTVVSSSPERFFKIKKPDSKDNFAKESFRSIETSPVKGTRPRGKTAAEDVKLQNELINSEKDRAENLMIVDLLRNDLGRICEFGSISVEKLCQLEIHPTLAHLVSTIKGAVSCDVKFSEILSAVFPCGSITGAPKISTMKIIEALEKTPRGLSMGAIGFSCANVKFPSAARQDKAFLRPLFQTICDFSVAIRTLTITGNQAFFNVGGGIVIDSDPESEYDEMLTKAKALLNSINAKI